MLSGIVVAGSALFLIVAWRQLRKKHWLAAALMSVLPVIGGVIFPFVYNPGIPSAKGDAKDNGAADGEWFLHAQPPLTDDELSAQNWLAYVTYKLPPEKETDYWKIGGRQYGVSSRRYHLAFIGYAAATLGMRTPAYSAVTAAILKNCIERMLRKDVWQYIQSPDYWGRKPWFPDPCYRENIMYSGHLLELLALYEMFSGDKSYWEKGFDFVWDKQNVVHYTAGRLVEVIAGQMRSNDSGGVTCEPGMLFFPCNNHPQIALRIFSALGHGDWTSERRKWENWALRIFPQPLFRGGVLKLTHFPHFGVTYPRGMPGMDAWGLGWYYPWSDNPETARRLWRRAAELAADLPPDRFAAPLQNPCCTPVKIPPDVHAVFFAAAARMYGDEQLAQRLEKYIDDRFLRRRERKFFLQMDREWRLGSTANRITALGIQRGSDWRNMVQNPLPRNYGNGQRLQAVAPDSIMVRSAYYESHGALHLELCGEGEAVLTFALPLASGNIKCNRGYALDATNKILTVGKGSGTVRLELTPLNGKK